MQKTPSSRTTRRTLPAPARTWTRGRVQVYTGNGKGKTTAALGLSLRAAGAGLRVFIAQFAKGTPCSELSALARLAPEITVRRFGRCGFIRGEPAPEDKAEARRGLAAARRALVSGRYHVVILDEAAVAARLGLLATRSLLRLLDVRPRAVELVITGRGAPDELLARADLVTEMREVKHYYARGIPSRAGIEA